MYERFVLNKNNENNTKEKKKGFFSRIFDTQRVGKGVPKAPPAKLDLKYFFKLFGRNISNIAKINLLFVFGNFPFLFALYATTGALNTNSFAPSSSLFAQLRGAFLISEKITPAYMALYGIHGVQATVSLWTPATYVFFGLTALIIFTFGPVNTGISYLIRSIIRGEPLFFMQDFIYAIKKNFRQSMIVGILDCVIITLLVFNIMLTYFNMGSTMYSIIFYANIMLAFAYYIMRYYIYLQLITFNLTIFKIFKNSFIFSILGGKRNLAAISGTGFALLIVYVMLILFFPLGIMLPFVILFGAGAFMGAYASYPKIKEIMIDPYYTTTDEAVTEEKPVFTDRG